MAVLGERVLLLRRRCKLQQRELAARVGVHYNTLSRVEQGRIRTLNTEVAAKLAQALGTTVDYLVGLTTEEGKPRTWYRHAPAP
jgi:transcriptional regulator with XRE-family HTH domain